MAKTIYVAKKRAKILEFQKQGPVGPPGIGVILAVAGINLSGHRIVYIAADGLAYYADKDSIGTVLNAVGLTTGAANQGTDAVILPIGKIDEPSWAWDVTKLVYLGNNGLLTQTIPDSGVILQIGIPLSATRLLVDIKIPIATIQ